MIFLSCSVHRVKLKMSEAAEASIVVEPYQFEPILTESDRESSVDESTNSDNGDYDRIGQHSKTCIFQIRRGCLI